MTLLLPILPIYVAGLGVSGQAALTLWSGVAYAATVVIAALTAPLWGRLSDRFGRKPMLIRASLGMAVAMSLIGMAWNIEQLVALRLLAGLLAGYASGSTILVAAQTPKRHSAAVLGVFSSAIMAGHVVGPLAGGFIGEIFGVRNTFLAAGALIFLGFLGTAFLLKEERKSPVRSRATHGGVGGGAAKTTHPHVAVPLSTTDVCGDLGGTGHHRAHRTPVGRGSARRRGCGDRLRARRCRRHHLRTWIGTAGRSDRAHPGPDAESGGSHGVAGVTGCCARYLAVRTSRFLMGVALGGVTPTLVATLGGLVPESSVGLVLGNSVSAQYAGQVIGPLAAGWVGGVLGTSAVFFMTAIVAGAGTVLAFGIRRRLTSHDAVNPG